MQVLVVLANDAAKPWANALPEALQSMFDVEPLRISHARLAIEAMPLIQRIKHVLGEVEREHTERIIREREVAHREARFSEQNTGVSAEAATEALSHWNEIQDLDDPDAYRVHLQRFPNALTAAVARRKLQLLEGDVEAAREWEHVSETDEPKIVEEYIRRHGQSRFVWQARQRLTRISDRRAWRSTGRWVMVLVVVGLLAGVGWLLGSFVSRILPSPGQTTGTVFRSIKASVPALPAAPALDDTMMPMSFGIFARRLLHHGELGHHRRGRRAPRSPGQDLGLRT